MDSVSISARVSSKSCIVSVVQLLHPIRLLAGDVPEVKYLKAPAILMHLVVDPYRSMKDLANPRAPLHKRSDVRNTANNSTWLSRSSPNRNAAAGLSARI